MHLSSAGRPRARPCVGKAALNSLRKSSTFIARTLAILRPPDSDCKLHFCTLQHIDEVTSGETPRQCGLAVLPNVVNLLESTWRRRQSFQNQDLLQQRCAECRRMRPGALCLAGIRSAYARQGAAPTSAVTPEHHLRHSRPFSPTSTRVTPATRRRCVEFERCGI